MLLSIYSSYMIFVVMLVTHDYGQDQRNRTNPRIHIQIGGTSQYGACNSSVNLWYHRYVDIIQSSSSSLSSSSSSSLYPSTTYWILLKLIHTIVSHIYPFWKAWWFWVVNSTPKRIRTQLSRMLGPKYSNISCGGKYISLKLYSKI